MRQAILGPLAMMVARLLLTVLVAAGTYASAAQSTGTQPFFFLQLSDPQFGMFTGDRDFAQETVNFEMAIATANRLRPAFVVVTGDLVNKPGDPAQIAEYERITSRLDASIPLYNVAGNHDVENRPTPASVAAYVQQFGRDYYSFTYRSLGGVVLDSGLISDPSGAPALARAQWEWTRAELAHLKQAGARHLVVFQHHSWFLADAEEPDQYYNIPRERRAPYLALLHEFGVSHVFSGHYHRNAIAADGGLHMITSGPVGKPAGEETRSGIRVVIVRDSGISHRYYGLGELPNTIDIGEK